MLYGVLKRNDCPIDLDPMLKELGLPTYVGADDILRKVNLQDRTLQYQSDDLVFKTLRGEVHASPLTGGNNTGPQRCLTVIAQRHLIIIQTIQRDDIGFVMSIFLDHAFFHGRGGRSEETVPPIDHDKDTDQRCEHQIHTQDRCQKQDRLTADRSPESFHFLTLAGGIAAASA